MTTKKFFILTNSPLSADASEAVKKCMANTPGVFKEWQALADIYPEIRVTTNLEGDFIRYSSFLIINGSSEHIPEAISKTEEFEGFTFKDGKIVFRNNKAAGTILTTLDALNEAFVSFHGINADYDNVDIEIDITKTSLGSDCNWWSKKNFGETLLQILFRKLSSFSDYMGYLKDVPVSNEKINNMAATLFLYEPLPTSLASFLKDFMEYKDPDDVLEMVLTFLALTKTTRRAVFSNPLLEDTLLRARKTHLPFTCTASERLIAEVSDALFWCKYALITIDSTQSTFKKDYCAFVESAQAVQARYNAFNLNKG